MTRFSTSMLLPSLIFAIGGVASAQTLGLASAPASASFFAHQISTLEAQGYHSIRETGDAAGRVTAIGPRGSEVIVTFNADQGTIARIDYLHLVNE